MRVLQDDPAWLRLAAEELGVHEDRNSSVVMGYAKSAKTPGYTNTSIAWCAAFMGAMLERSGAPGTGSLMARSYLKYGHACAPKRGCIIVLRRGRNAVFGHVGIYLRTLGDFVEVLSGNTKDSVCVQLFPLHDVLAYRWPDTELPAMKPATAQVPHGPSRPEASVPDPSPPVPASQVIQQAAPEKRTYDAVREELKAAGSRTIFGVDRIIGHVRKALLAIGVTAFTDVQSLSPVLMVVMAVAVLAILYEAMQIESARVDDKVNGQQARG